MIVFGKSMNKKHGPKKLVMSTEQMEDIFSPMFFCVLRKNIFSFFEKEICPVLCTNIYENIFPVFAADIRCFHQSSKIVTIQ